jgi:hypothetical protein
MQQMYWSVSGYVYFIANQNRFPSTLEGVLVSEYFLFKVINNSHSHSHSHSHLTLNTPPILFKVEEPSRQGLAPGDRKWSLNDG